MSRMMSSWDYNEIRSTIALFLDDNKIDRDSSLAKKISKLVDSTYRKGYVQGESAERTKNFFHNR